MNGQRNTTNRDCYRERKNESSEGCERGAEETRRRREGALFSWKKRIQLRSGELLEKRQIMKSRSEHGIHFFVYKFKLACHCKWNARVKCLYFRMRHSNEKRGRERGERIKWIKAWNLVHLCPEKKS